MRSVWNRLGRAGLAFLALGGLVPSARAEAPDFFERSAEYFKSETIEGVSKHAEDPKETPATVTLVGHDEIERYGFRTVADVLNFASMGSFSLGDRRYDLAGSRGLFLFEDYNTRILVMLDGHPLNEPWSNFADIGRAMLVPLDLVERIEIVYGPTSLLYGGYSLYGIVNVITRSAESLAGVRVRLTGGSWGTGEGVASWGHSGTYGDDLGTTGNWSVLAAAGYYTSQGEDLDLPRAEAPYPVDLQGGHTWGGPQSGTDFERAPFAFLKGRRGEVTLLARTGSRRRGTPFAPYGAIYGSGDQNQWDEKSLAELRWDRARSSRLNLSVRAFHDIYRYSERDPIADPVAYPGKPGYSFVLHSSDHDSGAEVRLSYRRGTHYLTVGSEYRYRTLSRESNNEFTDGAIARGSTIRQAVSGRFGVAYAQEEWRPVRALSLVAGGNWADTHPGGHKAQPRLAVILKPHRTLSMKALYGRGFRPPSIYEATYADFADFAGSIPNPSLRSEEISSGEASLIWKPFRRLTMEGYAFRSRLGGLIGTVKIASPSDVQGGVVGPGGTTAELIGQVQYQSTGDVRSSGAGGSLRFQGPRLEAYGNVAYANARHAGTDASRLPASAAWLASAGASWSARDWTLSMTAHFVGPQSLDPSRGGGTAGDYVEANLRALYRARLVYPVTVHVDVLNLSDTKGTVAASPVFFPPRLPIEGRRALVGAEIRF